MVRKKFTILNLTLVAFLIAEGPSLASNPNTKNSLAAPAQSAKSESRVWSDEEFKEKILNGTCCVPNLSTGYWPAKLKGGKFTKKIDNISEEVTVNKIIVGNLENKRVAVAFISDWSGGSGVFTSLILYEQKGAVAVPVGSHAAGDRAVLNLLEFQNGRLRYVSEEGIGTNAGKRHSFYLKKSDFEKVECILKDLPKETEADLAKLVKIYKGAFSGKLSPIDRQEATAIANRHQKEGSEFCEELRLSLEAEGFTPVSQPITFEHGKAKLHMEDSGQVIELPLK